MPEGQKIDVDILLYGGGVKIATPNAFCDDALSVCVMTGSFVKQHAKKLASQKGNTVQPRTVNAALCGQIPLNGQTYEVRCGWAEAKDSKKVVVYVTEAKLHQGADFLLSKDFRPDVNALNSIQPINIRRTREEKRADDEKHKQKKDEDEKAKKKAREERENKMLAEKNR